ncbi:MAG: serine/threonine protein kinase [Deltaproteobacteria bacterium]|nr:MAG: serine/threonine protein kinase [Deltaproteobacteria bacterium]
MAENVPNFEPKPFGRYVLLNKLAVGGMAEIYKAKTYGVDGFEKVLAVKRILPHCSADREFINMLVDEAKLTVLLSHANIVQVYDLGKVGDDYFISMEYIFGTNLREFMNRFQEKKTRIPDEMTVYIISEMCKGLDYAHRKTDNQGRPLNIVHRDISPQNLLISYEGEVKIVDFGIAKAAMNVSHTMAGILKGKVAYMSPEQALGKPIDHRTDIFSAGLVLYEMLTGEKLFTGETQFEVLNQIRTTRVNTLMLPDTIPGSLKAIIAKSLAYNPKDRYQNAGDFQLDLTKFLYSSYVDFSPRNLASTMHEMFQGDIKKKEATVISDEKTNSAIIKQIQVSEKDDILAHANTSKSLSGLELKAEPATDRLQVPHHTPHTSTEIKIHDDTLLKKFENTAPSITVGKSTKKSKSGPALAIIGILIVLGLTGFFSYKFFKPHQPTPTPQPSPQPTPQPTPQAEISSIVITTTPPGAKVYLNGSLTNLETPATMDKLETGREYQIRLVKDGFEDFTKIIPLTSTTPFKLETNLVALKTPTAPQPPIPTKGSIQISSFPTGAKIFVDGHEMSQATPAEIRELEVGRKYSFKLQLPNYAEWSSVVDVKSADPITLQATLIPVPQTPPAPTPTPQEPLPTPMLGSINVTSKPSGAKITLNGKYTGKTTPDTLKDLPANQKTTITLSKDGYQDWSKSVTVAENRSMDIAGSLKEIKTEPTPPPPAPKPQETPKEPTPAPPPHEPEPTSGVGSITVNTEPSGMEVYANSELKGETPLTISNLPSGTVKLVFRKGRLQPFVQNVKLGAGESKNLGTIALYGELKISSSPPRATVLWNGVDVGEKTPVTLKGFPRDKSYPIKVQLDGFKTWENNVSLDSDVKKLEIELEKD